MIHKYVQPFPSCCELGYSLSPLSSHHPKNEINLFWCCCQRFDQVFGPFLMCPDVAWMLSRVF